VEGREAAGAELGAIPTDTDRPQVHRLDTLVTPELLERTHFDSPVASVEYGTDSVAVTTNSGERHHGDKALVTVPIAILQRETIRFDPPLPAEKRSEIMKEEVPGGLKVFIEFSKCFYPDVLNVGPLFRGNALDNCSYYNAAFGKQSKQHVLGFFAQGSKAERYLACGTEDEIFGYMLRELDEIFNGQASEHYVKHIVQDWSREPYIQGSYSQRKANAEKLAEPIAGRVYFAGEAMNPNGKTIAVHGACESAYAAVAAIQGETS
jgi:monoamine oxidase